MSEITEIERLTKERDLALANADAVYAKLMPEVERLRNGVQDYLDGNYGPRAKKNDKCPHNLYGYEVCGQCIDDHFAAIIGHQQNGRKE